MARYKYYQTAEKAPWEIIEETRGLTERLLELDAKRVSILSVSQPIVEETDVERVTYKGPFYADIDDANIDVAVAAARAFDQKLQDLQVPEQGYAIFCSGSKGFHFIVHEKVFSDARPLPHLPYIYKLMAVDLYVPGLDFSPYAGGKGNLFRLENVRRGDGRFRIRISREELHTMTEAYYLELCSQARENALPDFPGKDVGNVASLPMMGLFSQARKRHAEDHRRKQTMRVEDEDLTQFHDEPPQCVRDLCESKRNHNGNFNQVAFQLAIFAVRSGIPLSRTQSLIDLLAKNTDSDKYMTRDDRSRHVVTLTHFVANSADKHFSCNAMRSVLNTKPCTGCPLSTKYSKDAPEDDKPELLETSRGYYAERGRRVVELTNFLLEVESQLLRIEEGVEVREAVTCHVIMAGDYIGKVQIAEEDWGSRQGFLHCFNSLSNCAVRGSESDIQLIKKRVLSEMEVVTGITAAHAIGMHGNRDTRLFTYVEPERSINGAGIEDTFQLTVDRKQLFSGWIPVLQQRVPASWEIQQNVLQCMFHMNSPHVTANILGWLGACHLKSHIMAVNPEFPLLNLYGARGSAKTMSAALFSAINGCDYFQAAPMIAQSSSVYGIKSLLASTTTVPVVLDEVNREVFGDSRKEGLADVLKGVWNAQNTVKGNMHKLTGNATRAVPEFVKLTSPLMMLSETRLDSHALVDRCVVVMMSATALHDREAQKDYVQKHYRHMFPFAKALVMRAVRMDLEWVQRTLQEWQERLPMYERDEIRPHYSRAVIGLGLSFLQQTCRSVGMTIDPLLTEYIERYIEFCRPASLEQMNKVRPHRENECDTLLTVAFERYLAARQGSTGMSTFPSAFSFDSTRNTVSIDIAAVCGELRVVNKGSLRLRTDEYLEQMQQHPAFRTIGPGPNSMGLPSVVTLDIRTLRERNHAVPFV